jgi:hypothetical protein
VKKTDEQLMETDDLQRQEKTNSTDKKYERAQNCERKFKQEVDKDKESKSPKEVEKVQKKKHNEKMTYAQCPKKSDKIEAHYSSDDSSSDTPFEKPSKIECTEIVSCTEDKPYQPREKEILSKMRQTKATRTKTVSRTFQEKWFDDFP